MTTSQRVARIEAEAVGRDLSSWEKHQFLPSIKQRATLSEKQEKAGFMAGVQRSGIDRCVMRGFERD